MMNTARLNSFITQEALKGFPVEQPGRIYSTLCVLYPLRKVKNKKQHSLALGVLTKLSELLQKTEKMAADDKKQIMDYMDALGLLVEEYEKKNFDSDLDSITGVEILEFLMEEHSLKQNDLKRELGGQSVVSEILSRKRKLNSHQILALSKRFGVSPSAFFP